jgi:O-antigen/teichoic acid export membrane protein
MDLRRAGYVLLYGISAAAGLAKLIAYARLLGPEGFGLVSLALLTVAIAAYVATGGLLEGLASRAPLMRGRGEDVRHVRSVAFAFATTGGIALGLVLSAVMAIAPFEDEGFRVLVWTGPFLAATVFLMSLMCDLQVREKSVEYAGVLCLKSTLAIAFAIPLASLWGAAGVLIAEIASQLACAALVLGAWSRDLGWKLDARADAGALARSGIPFVGGSLAQNLGSNVDRWAVQFGLGVGALGQYAFAMNFASAGSVLLSMIQLYATPRMLRRYGATGDPRELVRSSRAILVVLGAAFLLGMAPFLFAFRYVVDSWFPEYSLAADLSLYIYAGTAAITAAFFDILFRATGNATPVWAVHATVAVAAGLACIVATQWHAELVVYAMVFAAARLAAACAGWTLAVRGLRLSRRASVA